MAANITVRKPIPPVAVNKSSHFSTHSLLFTCASEFRIPPAHDRKVTRVFFSDDSDGHGVGCSTPDLKSYLFERRAGINSLILRSEAGPLKNFPVLLSDETVGNFSALHGLPILADVVKVIS